MVRLKIHSVYTGVVLETVRHRKFFIELVLHRIGILLVIVLVVNLVFGNLKCSHGAPVIDA